MTGAVPPLPDGAPQPEPQGPAGVEGMMGPNPAPNSQPAPDARLNAQGTLIAVKNRLDELYGEFKKLSNQYPEFSEAATAITQAGQAGYAKIVASQLRNLEGPPPPTAAV